MYGILTVLMSRETGQYPGITNSLAKRTPAFVKNLNSREVGSSALEQ